ncbi:bifunctional tRNA (5-methylaminomethyl-2-thiouridine)(34)-methyltransferase MnmD/FAD-dependent 5-carboxymethylaminomethyl-2-thiouridine(34) oxidoreductase MnmC [Vibrio mimicus]|uniref:bifunctional tRNA (5-methylaminomethyl-2-thiouridine)(34)-methyltransferase MnmD/FAD-dependent 5-carboxymethylaminomethyl-2-thiouridine(34) oxidoreductase MnmC n=1 Tax=Vibrio mimicus TaxID=674 RepID=UPI0018EEE34F|nr:bifunctional tRNA (5-methylaminomethyl-2-thiouridine)(34)-methyltransferase MnmD/FAD-dependent 5-carboxymethylaminomethyl-2-thiouridine(34) oxidoreductase MnmC [Vibrio mimicus]
MSSISHAQLGWNEAGTPVSDQFDDVYFSNVNGLAETRYVFLEQNHLPQRWHNDDQRRFVIAETGFGTGLNFLAVWQAFVEFRQANPDAKLKELHFISFEKYPLSKHDLIQAHQAWPELAEFAQKLHKLYPLAIPECQRIVLDDGLITLDLWFGDIKDCLPKVATQEQGLVDAWFLDGFAPSKNPEMWNQNLFEGMAKLAKNGCTCATFTSAGIVRRGLIDAGFTMKKVKGFGTKREMIAGCLNEKISYTNIAPEFRFEATNGLRDVAIIGGGVASATLATTLAKRGISVTLYCADEKPAQGASGNRQGAVYPLLSGDHNSVSRVFAPAFLFARQFIEQAAEQITFDHDWCGVTQLMWDEKATQKLTSMLEGDFPEQLVHGLSAEQTNQQVGVPVDQASVHYPLGGWLCPAELTQSLIHLLEQQGKLTAHYQTQIDTLTWQPETQQWQLHCGDKVMQHQCVVIASGHQFDSVTQTAQLPLGKVKGQVSHIPTTDTLSNINSVLCYDGYMTPVSQQNGHHCIGASYDRQHLDATFDPQAQRENAQKLIHCLPEQTWPLEVDISGNQSRQGVRCVSRDHLPFVGNVGEFTKITEQYRDLAQQTEAEPIALYPQLYVFAGLGSRGLSSAPLMAELLASQMCGDPLPLGVDLLEQLHPCRMWVRKLRKGKALTQKA